MEQAGGNRNTFYSKIPQSWARGFVAGGKQAVVIQFEVKCYTIMKAPKRQQQSLMPENTGVLLAPSSFLTLKPVYDKSTKYHLRLKLNRHVHPIYQQC